MKISVSVLCIGKYQNKSIVSGEYWKKWYRCIPTIDVWFVRIGQYLAEIQLFENLESESEKFCFVEKITFKVVQRKLLAMHITNQK